jgi:hypothetical protein
MEIGIRKISSPPNKSRVSIKKASRIRTKEQLLSSKQCNKGLLKVCTQSLILTLTPKHSCATPASVEFALRLSLKKYVGLTESVDLNMSGTGRRRRPFGKEETEVRSEKADEGNGEKYSRAVGVKLLVTR